MTYLMTGDLDLVDKHLKRLIYLEKELSNTFEKVWIYILLARRMLQGEIQHNLVMEYTRKALTLAKDIKFNHFWIAWSHISAGLAYYYFCEYKKSVKHRLKSLEVCRKIGNKYYIAWNINDIGVIYSTIGNYDLALKYFQDSLSLRKDHEYIEVPLSNLIEAALEKDDFELARKYFKRLEDLYLQKKGNLKYGPQIYTISKALILKASSRIRDKAKAEEILKEIIESKQAWPIQLKISANILICDLLLAEFRLNNNEEVLEEVNHYLANLLTLAEKEHSYLVFCEAFLLKAKLALFNFEIKTARRFLTQAQKIAESNGIRRLEMKISYEHDMLLKQKTHWENLKESESTVSDRWKLAGLNDQIDNLIKKRMVDSPEVSKEEPVMLLILTQGGDLIFSKRFVENIPLEDDILGGFLTTINYFITEVFSEGLDRAVFGQYTLHMMPLKPFLICYIFKGYSYFAHQKIKNFLDIAIWQSLQTFFQNCKVAQLNDIPSLELLMTEIFMERKK